MSSFRCTSLPARPTGRGGFTLVELLVVIGIIAILAGVALGPITSGIKTAQHNTAMQASRSIALLCFQYSVDNSVYPSGTNTDGTVIAGGNTSEGVAQQLLQGKYTGDPTIFYLSAPNSKSKYKGVGGTYADFGSANVTWDFMALSGTGTPAVNGITSSASDLLPLVWCSGNAKVTPPTSGNGGQSLQLQANNPFAYDGIAVTYKSNSAQFIRSNSVNAIPGFISTSYSDPNTYIDLSP